MHEMMLVESVAKIVLRQAKLAEAEEVLSVTLQVGEIRDVVDELMEKCFRFISKGTIAENATLNIIKVPFIVKCNNCGTEKKEEMSNLNNLHCDSCGSTDMKLVSGREFFVDDIEIR
ncbi:MAG: hydrogenase maturation nickel metallochaperone HypA [Firmicutes bacterium]|nr:hydrogenase maturation nickel metallochaperone HypA [Bacillota bacterium]